MMETVLNVGLNDASVHGPGRAGRRRPVRLGLLPPPRSRCSARPCSDIDAEHFARRPRRREEGQGHARTTSTWTPATSRTLVETFKGIIREHAGRDFPQDPREQLDLAVRAVFDSWNSPRANVYRRQERIPADLGTAVSVCSMVFGNLGMDSGTGVAFTRDPASGARGVYGDYLQNAQGEDVVAGIRNTLR